MRIFVTGATGFIGAHLCRTLVASGHEVLALVRDPKKAANELAPGIESLEGDLSLFTREDLVLPSCDVVVHLAGVVSATTLEAYDAINFRAVQHLVEALARQTWRPRRFLFASSLAAAGPTERGVPKTERDRDAPIEPYGRAKLKAEQYLRAHAPFPTTSFRPALVFGPRDPASLSFFKMAKRGVGFRVAGAPQELSYIDVGDVVSAILAMMADPSEDHRRFFVSAREQTDSQRLWEVMAKAIGRRVQVIQVPRTALRGAVLASTGLSKVLGFTNQLDAKQYAQMVAPAFLCASDALQGAYGWTPRLSLEGSLSRAWRAYQADGWL